MDQSQKHPSLRLHPLWQLCHPLPSPLQLHHEILSWLHAAVCLELFPEYSHLVHGPAPAPRMLLQCAHCR